MATAGSVESGQAGSTGPRTGPVVTYFVRCHHYRADRPSSAFTPRDASPQIWRQDRRKV